MKTYRKVIRDGLIGCVAIGEFGEEITESEYNEILSLIRNTPTAPDGYYYMLRAADFEWVLFELPPMPDPSEEEIDDAEAFEMLFGGAV